MPVLFNFRSLKEASLTGISEYLTCFRRKSVECTDNVFHHSELRQGASGQLATSLPEDLLTLLATQMACLDEYLRIEESESQRIKILDDTMAFCVQNAQCVHSTLQPLQWTDPRDSAAAANDSQVLAEKLERWMESCSDKYGLDESSGAFAHAVEAFTTQLSRDSVKSAECLQLFMIRSIHQSTSIRDDLFSWEWEDIFTQNQVIIQLLRHAREHLDLMEQYLASEYLFHKTYTAVAKAIVCFYIRCLVETATTHRRKRGFSGRKRSLIRMQDDIKLIKEFFDGKGNTTLYRVVANEFQILDVIHECMAQADEDSIESFIVVIHKRTGADSLVTRYFVGDLWSLVSLEKLSADIFRGVEPDLRMVSRGVKERPSLYHNTELSYVRLDEMLKSIYEERVAQGLVPLCWTCVRSSHDDEPHGLARGIRTITRHVVEMKWKGKFSRSQSKCI